jgi:hypothetical protein
MKRKNGQQQTSKRKKSSDAAAPDAVVIREGPGFTQLSLPPGQVCQQSNMQQLHARQALIMARRLSAAIHDTCGPLSHVLSFKIALLCVQGVVVSGCAALEVVSGCVRVFG